MEDPDELAFWSMLDAEHEALSAEQRDEYLHDESLSDDLDDPADDAIAAREGW